MSISVASVWHYLWVRWCWGCMENLCHQRTRRCTPQRRWTVSSLHKISMRSPNYASGDCRVQRDDSVFSSLELVGNYSGKNFCFGKMQPTGCFCWNHMFLQTHSGKSGGFSWTPAFFPQQAHRDGESICSVWRIEDSGKTLLRPFNT